LGEDVLVCGQNFICPTQGTTASAIAAISNPSVASTGAFFFPKSPFARKLNTRHSWATQDRSELVYTRLDKPTSHQAPLAPGVASIAITHFRIFQTNIKCLASRCRHLWQE
jgi:hypothetical protein